MNRVIQRFAPHQTIVGFIVRIIGLFLLAMQSIVIRIVFIITIGALIVRTMISRDLNIRVVIVFMIIGIEMIIF